MGIEFRGSHYRKDVNFGKRTVKDGEAVAIWNRYGEHRQVIGPRLVRLFFSTIRFLDKKTAGPKEYLHVELTNGTIEHLRGPVTLFENPVMHSVVDVRSAISLYSSSDCIVIHRQADTVFDKSAVPSGLSNESIQRVVIRGPNTYYPGPREEVLLSSKTAASLNKGNVDNVQNHYIFQLASRSWNITLPFGTDKLKGTVNLAFRFSITDIEAMLDHTSDLTGDLLDAVTADMVNFAAACARQSCSIDDLGSFNAFPGLLTKSASMGVLMESVSFRGFEPSAESRRAEDAVKDMQTAMARNTMLAEQEEKRIAAEISARQARLTMEHNLEEAVLAGKQARLASEQEFNRKQLECEEDLERSRIQARLEYHRLVNDESMRVLKGLQDLGADITKLLCEGNKSTGAKAGIVTGREAVLKTSPALNDWFSAPEAGTEIDTKKVTKK